MGVLAPAVGGLGYECGYVTVPLRHAAPAGPTIRLPVAILPAQSENPRPDPLFLAQGGPGASAFEVFPLLVAGSPLNQDRDLVIFNQRGTLFAEPDLLCPETLAAMDEMLPLPEDEAEAVALAASAACYERLRAAGIDLSAFNSVENAADVEAIRQALGYETFNFYGVSYGTLLGFHLMRQQPEHLRSVILDGVVPPNLNFIPEIPENENRIYNELFAACAADPFCSEAYPNLEERFFALVDQFNAEPLIIPLADPETGVTADALFDGNALVDALFQVFYLEDAFAVFPKLVANLEEGDTFYLEQILPLFIFDRTSSEGFYWSVICAEDADFDPAAVPLAELVPPIAAGAVEELQSYQDYCAIWQVDLLPPTVDEPVTSDIPALLLSGRFDPITPPAFAEIAAASLSNATHLVDPIGSHGVAFSNPCINQIVLDFLEAPQQPVTADCLAERQAAAFVPPSALTLPVLADVAALNSTFLWQAGLAGLLLFVVLSAVVVWAAAFVINWLRRRQRPLGVRERRLRWIGRGLVLLFGLLALAFVVPLAVLVMQMLLAVTPTVSIFAVPGAAAPLFVLPLLLALLAVGIGVTAVLIWREAAWPRWDKIYYTFVALCAVGYVLILHLHGLTTVLL